MRRTLIALLLVGLVLTAPCAAHAAPELSVSSAWPDRRYDVAGERARTIGFEDGRFYANGWHITGEMGGVWTRAAQARRRRLVRHRRRVGRARHPFTSGWGYAKFDLPSASGLTLKRTDFVPDGRRAALFGLKMTQSGGELPHGHGQGRCALRADDRVPVGASAAPTPTRREPAGLGAVRRRGRRARLPGPGQAACATRPCTTTRRWSPPP